MAKKVYIDVGHGGNDSGAIANGFKEKDLNLSVTNYCTAYLKARGVSVKQSRTSDVNQSTNSKQVQNIIILNNEV